MGRPVQIRMRGKAARALLRHTKTAMQDLQHDEDEMLRGWHHVDSLLVALPNKGLVPSLCCAKARCLRGHACWGRAEEVLKSAGVDWGAVEDFVDLGDHLRGFAQIEREEHQALPQKCVPQALS